MIVRACCGLTCSDCPANVARRTSDDGLRARTAQEWSRMYGVVLSPSQIDCDGCTAEGVHIGHCDECEVRRCCTGKGLCSCGACEEYPGCGIIESFLSEVPAARAVLDSVAAECRDATGRDKGV